MLHRRRNQAEKDRDNAARRARYKKLTRVQKDINNKKRAKRRRWRYMHDPAWAAKKRAARLAWTTAKRARCKEYVTLERLRSKQDRLRNAVAHHQGLLERFDRELIETTLEVERLARVCRGK
jgi:hypothetical protein